MNVGYRFAFPEEPPESVGSRPLAPSAGPPVEELPHRLALGLGAEQLPPEPSLEPDVGPSLASGVLEGLLG